ncbi:hypothetical protein [Nannocystis bainbridge]|uniref:Uncharacterized protein n=1 Tax=Nannocystis bainbridge TaxID=2995303 RepID=A0ABT5DS79_9BACT|nr:hypothetical protein [Nannocystis bainbridge]MDC0716500.1 hypothetical protein [Nannocystis bainbridge]
MWIFDITTKAGPAALLVALVALSAPAIAAEPDAEDARAMTSILDYIDDSQGLDSVENDAIRLGDRGDFVVLRGPSQIEVKVTQGPRGGQRTTSYIIRRIEYGTLYRLTNNETSGWDIDIEVRLRVAQ